MLESPAPDGAADGTSYAEAAPVVIREPAPPPAVERVFERNDRPAAHANGKLDAAQESAPAAPGDGQGPAGDGNQEGRGDRWGRRDRRDRGPRPERRFERERPDGRGQDERDYFEDRPQRERPDRPALPTLNIAEMEATPREALLALAEQMNLEDAEALRKPDLIFRLLQAQAEARGNIFSGGFLEVSDDGNYGFLRGERMLPGPHDIYVSQSQLRRFALRPGDYVTGQVRQPRDNEKYYGLLKVEAVNGIDPEVAKRRPFFENLTAIFPKEQLKLETTPDNLTHRIIDLVAPIGRGQRGLIVSPPKAGKTMLLKNIANGITANYPDIHLIVLLIGERPEEVTDMARTVRGEVLSSTFDEPVEDQTRVAEMALERAKRLVEGGMDVVILMDSITRLTRAYNVALPSSGRTLSGGVDPIALYPPKRLFGAARKCDEGGSLTILATCLVDTGSRMDEVVFEEFKGTGNLELRLDRKLAERRFYPAIDIQASSTRREELLLDEKTLKGVYLVRRMTAMISQNSPNQLEATERLLERIARSTTNEEFISSLKTDL
jgi:transcription termination factor Rho